jgi:predicted acylesterase/phospholipase RssA
MRFYRKLLFFAAFIFLYKSGCLYKPAFTSEKLHEEEECQAKQKPALVIAIDGGGVRGIIPAKILAKIEEVTGRPITEQVDLMVGTSTGSILTQGLNVPDETGKQKFSAAEAVELYTHHSATIFDRSWQERLCNPWGVRGPLYSQKNLKRVLKQYMADTPQSHSILPTVLTTYDIDRHEQVIFCSLEAKKGIATDFPMYKLVQASCAAPAYFPPKTLKFNYELQDSRRLMDGCLFAINPAHIAYKKAKELFPGREIYLISLGTGRKQFPTPRKTEQSWGCFGWLFWTSQELLYTQNHEVSQRLERKLNRPGQPKHFFRLQVDIDYQSGALDNASPENIAYLKEKADELIETNPIFQEVLHLLTQMNETSHSKTQSP